MKFLIIFTAFIIVCALTISFVLAQSSSSSVTVNASIPSVCGNGVLDAGEECDGANLGGHTCASRGFTEGTLSCNSNCTFNTSACVTIVPSGGGTSVPTTVVFSGRAYALGTVTLLKDGEKVAETSADSGANFLVQTTGLSGGYYLFSLSATDSAGRTSELLSYPLFIPYNIITNVRGVFFAPTAETREAEVKAGEPVTVFGETVPGADVTVAVSGKAEKTFVIKANADGTYRFSFSSVGLPAGVYRMRARAEYASEISRFGKAAVFTVGAETVVREPERPVPPEKPAPAEEKQEKRYLPGDLNEDGFVNLIDFSIASYWYLKPFIPEFAEREKNHLNGDGILNLKDFSIMMYYWTG